MYSPERKLSPPDDFNFPYDPPYDIQQDLMRALYNVIENRKIGIFESPTGTGKSLTLTCGALKWLLDHEKLVREELNEKITALSRDIIQKESEEAKNTDWIESQFNTIQKKEKLIQFKKFNSTLEQYDKLLQDIKQKRSQQEKKFKEKWKENYLSKNMPDEFNSNTSVDENDDENVLNSSFEDENDCGKNSEKNDSESYSCTKIYFLSRTHSQLSQVMQEVKRTSYRKEIRCISLASRQNLCLNPTVRKLNSNALINEKCLDLQRKTKPQSKTTCLNEDGCIQKKSRLKHSPSLENCPFKNSDGVNKLREKSLFDILDIEDLVSAGKKLNACPYYSGRAAVKDAHLIMLPYQLFLHRRTRLQSGISLKNSIVIVDEAHNLIEAIASMYSSEINLYQLESALEQMTSYKTKYFNRFHSKNLLRINQIIFITKRLIKLLKKPPLSPKSLGENEEQQVKVMKAHELMSEGEFFNINIFDLLDFCEKTRFATKVQELAQRIEIKNPDSPKNNGKENGTGSNTVKLLKKLEEQVKEKVLKKTKSEKNATNKGDIKEIPETSENQPITSQSNVIRPLLGFLESLTESPEDGRIFLHHNEDDKKLASMKFVLLNPREHFEEIIKDCRSIIIAGGTMQPISDTVNQLFKSCPERISTHFYGHVVPKGSIFPVVIEKGPKGKRLLFNFLNRFNPDMFSELSEILQNICKIVPGGIVCFFTSYNYLETIYDKLERNGALQNIELSKRIFREPRSTNSEVNGQSDRIEKILSDYSTCIRNCHKNNIGRQNGAILFAVVNGKLSEGLNFSDDLGRCVILVGLPFPNRQSPELIEKIKYVETISKHNSNAGNEYYENLCMKAVNQCIGRSIRHINDYACVFLLDERYSSMRIKSKLPQWILQELHIQSNFSEEIQNEVKTFFENKRKTTEISFK